jgi:succinate dehydrogenase/fumarate reductase flavoprotein subunit
MWQQVGVLRDGKDLASAIKKLEAMDVSKCEKPGRSDYETRNLHTLALLIARSALARVESRGSHYRADFPYRDDEDFARHSLVQKGKDVGFEK